MFPDDTNLFINRKTYQICFLKNLKLAIGLIVSKCWGKKYSLSHKSRRSDNLPIRLPSLKPHLVFFMCNQGQASALKVTYIFKVFGAQSCLMVAQQFHQVTYVCKEYNNFQDSKSIRDFKTFPIILLRIDILRLFQRTNSTFF